MNNPHFLICVEKPNYSGDKPSLEEAQQWIFWRDFLKSLKADQKLFADAEQVADNIWIFPATAKLTSLLAFLALAKVQLQCKIFFLESTPIQCQ
jgi:hypothetical protein